MGRINRIKIAVFLCGYLVFIASSPASATGENEKVVAGLKQKPPVREWSFAVLGDNRYSCQTCDWAYERVISSMGREPFDFAINTGDFVNTGTEGEYQGYLERIRKLGFPTINILGNHDLPPDDISNTGLFEKYFGQPYFYFDYQNARFIILNNSAHEFGEGQRAWLDKTLAEAKGRLKFVFMHIPTFNPSRRSSYLIKWDDDYKPFEEIIQRHKVDILFTGHLHLLHDSIYQGTRTIITGGAGAPLYETPEEGGVYHWVKVLVKGKSVMAEPGIIPTPYGLRIIYRTVFFFNYEIRDHWKVYLLVFFIFLLSIFLLKIRRERGKKVNR